MKDLDAGVFSLTWEYKEKKKKKMNILFLQREKNREMNRKKKGEICATYLCGLPFIALITL